MSDYKTDLNPKYAYLAYNKNRVKDIYRVHGVVFMKNGCCEDQPVLITANYNPSVEGGVNYSCQCGCGIWCTTGHPTPVGALRDYQTMSNNNVPLMDDYPKRI